PQGEVLFNDGFESTAPLSSGQGPADPRFGDIYGSEALTVLSDASLPFRAYSGSKVLRVGSPGVALTHWIKQELGGTAQQPRDRVYFALRLYLPAAFSEPLRFMMIRGSRLPWG